MPHDLRKMAEGKQCYLRLPGFCRHDPRNTSLAHIRRGNIAGVGQKPVDINGIPACDVCHAIFDGRMMSPYSRAELDAEMLRALCQWLNYLWTEEYIIVVAA